LNLDSDGTLEAAILLAQNWFVAQTNGRRLRLDTFQAGPDITFVRLPRSDAEYVSFGVRIREPIEADLAAMGFGNSAKISAVYYGGGGPSSGGQIPCGQAPRPGRFAAVYVGCILERPDVQPLIAVHGVRKILAMTMVHEILHNLGAVPDCARHQIAAHASDDPRDVMVASGSGQLASYPEPEFLPILDAGRDDYYAHTNAGCVDVANSEFLDLAPRVSTAVASAPAVSVRRTSSGRP
jgi:hypothetical protein